MAASERLAVLIFLIAAALLYITELFLVGSFVLSRVQSNWAVNLLWRKWAWPVHLLAITGVLCLVYGYFVEPKWIKVTKFQIKTPKLRSTKFRIVHISDLHCEQKPRNEEKLTTLVNQLQPDIIVFTGDAVNSAEAIELFGKTMGDLDASVAKLAVRGNWDYRAGLAGAFQTSGFQLLENRTVRIEKNGETVCVSGMNCGRNHDHKRLLGEVGDELFSIFLYHYSDFVEELQGLNVDLYLCGHTHGGQVALPFYGALVTLSKFGKKYESGWYKVDDTILYVNRGIGMEGGFAPKVRFLASPEITVFDIVPEE